MYCNKPIDSSHASLRHTWVGLFQRIREKPQGFEFFFFSEGGWPDRCWYTCSHLHRKLVENKRFESLEPLAPRYLQYEKAPEQHGLIST
jgi:hypothetical protein